MQTRKNKEDGQQECSSDKDGHNQELGVTKIFMNNPPRLIDIAYSKNRSKKLFHDKHRR